MDSNADVSRDYGTGVRRIGIRATSWAISLVPCLIFFMVSTTFKEDARIQVQLPEAQGEDVPAEEPRVLEIIIDGTGTFYVNERMVVDRKLATLKKAIAGAAGEDREIPVVIKADAETPHQAVMTAMDAASQLGLLSGATAGGFVLIEPTTRPTRPALTPMGPAGQRSA